MSEQHEHEHGHGHGHEHGHEQVLIDGEGVKLTLLEHQGSLVASYWFDMAGSLEEARGALADFASALADAVTEQGGLVGHVKAFAQERGKSCRISVTLHDPDIVDFEEPTVHVEGVAIVMLVEKEWYSELVKQRLRSLLGQ